MAIKKLKTTLYRVFMMVLAVLVVAGCTVRKDKNFGDKGILIENAEYRLVLNSDGTARSLIHKATGQECLDTSVKVPVFSITQYRPYDNEVMLAYPAKKMKFASDSIYRSGDDLIVNFELTDYEAVIAMNITDHYIGFTLKKLEYHMAKFGVKRRTEIDEFTLMQLPVKDRARFGEWLNVVWDDDVAVNLLASDPYARIDAEDRDGYKLMTAGAVTEVKLRGVGAALIVTGKNKLLDDIDQLERDYGLPLGVKSRRAPEYKNSYYEMRNATPENIDEHIAFAKKGGFRQMVIYYPDFAKTCGHFPWRKEYAHGMADLKGMADKVRAAGMILGAHIHYNKAYKNDAYVSPVPDPRLNIRRHFTLMRDLGKTDEVIYVAENPAGCTLEEGRRFLKIGNELATYEHYTTTPPYRFTGCARGALNTKISKRKKGDALGLLDVDTWPLFVRFDQKTDIQQEVAERWGEIYKGAGLQFIYFDGSEDVPRPYWFNVPWAKLITYNAFDPPPVFSEGAVKAHFGWHIQSRGNAFDVFPPKYVKEATRKHPMKEAEMIANDFTSLNFGWNDYVAPGENTIGMQPDMYEFITSKAAAWDCPIALIGKLDQLKAHPRTPDNLEVIRRWEEVRARNFLTEQQKTELRNPAQEYTLLIDENDRFELQPYRQIDGTPENVRAFVFNRKGTTWAVYWNPRGAGTVKLPVAAGKIRLYEKPGEEMTVDGDEDHVLLPNDRRRYVSIDLPESAVIRLFQGAEIL